MAKKYIMVGNAIKKGVTWQFEDGSTENGLCFKDEEAYLTDWDKPCYVPENGFPTHNDRVVEWDSYTHNSLLKLCFNNKKLCDAVFYAVDWQYPETYLEELNNSCDFKEFWDFVKAGSKVHWRDPDGMSSGTYSVVKVQDHGPDDEDWCPDEVVLISNGTSEAEVPLYELEDID